MKYQQKLAEIEQLVISGQMDTVAFSDFRKLGIGDDWARQMRAAMAESGLLLKAGNRYSVNYGAINQKVAA